MEAAASPAPSDAMAAASSTTVMGKYQLGRLLGRGTFAKVYAAKPLPDGAEVAIKIIDKTSPITMMMEPQITREVAAMRKLRSHPNILKIHEVMATKKKIFLVMELATGGDLFSRLRRRGGRLSETVARRYFRQLISALQFCHENGIAHRDLKPQNLLLDKTGALRVSDFGLSALLPEQLRSDGLLHTACGTPGFTAPEVLRGRGYDGARADAWSCGAILFLLLAGSLPFEDLNFVTLYDKMNRRDYVIPECVSKPARHVIRRLLDPNPSSRMTLQSLTETSWFKKTVISSSNPGSEPKSGCDCSVSDSDSVSSMNAFDIISLSSGLDLSGFFEGPRGKQGKRFVSSASFEAISEKMTEVGEKLGFNVEKGRGGSIELGKGLLALSVVVSEIAASLFLVEVKVVCGGGPNFEELYWGGLREGLQEIVISWHNDLA